MTSIDVEQVATPGDLPSLVELLSGDEWPFHSSPRPTADDVAAMTFDDESTVSFWIVADGERVGLIRLLDLDDAADGDGSPLFDVRLAHRHRRRGLGSAAVRWLTGYLFDGYPAIRRVEATTRDDNLAMQRVLDRCGYTCEGRLRESWPGSGDTWHDTLVYAILRREHDHA
jgi:RimJ/RimL family protein N-acetyltransferase